ncbi:hypothetical protein F4805DRAFT_477184 [Annulohypoxylon moriforme]|nr:hypothetical protein F4805DRAFT_477184 [Annulohypoxylon moriforme]
MALPPTTYTPRERSQSSPPLPLPIIPSSSSFNTNTKPTLATDLESHTYTSPRQRRTLQSLSRTYTDRNSNMVGAALHYLGIRRTRPVVNFIDSARDYDQELLDLRFKLAGPNSIPYIATLDAEKAIASLRRALRTLARGGWWVMRLEDLWATHCGCEASGKVTWNQELDKSVDTNKLDAELACHHFWQRAQKKGFHQLIRELKNETKRMKTLVSAIEQNREPPFVRELRQKKSRKARAPPFPPVESASLSTNCPFFSSDLRDPMSAALPVAANKKRPIARLSRLKARLAKTKIYKSLRIEPAVLLLKTQYQVLKAQEKWRNGKNPETTRKAWTSFRANLEKYPAPPYTDVILLTYKTDTRILLAEQHSRQSSVG